MLHHVSVKGLTLDPLTNSPIVVLSQEGEDRALPIWIAVPEANAIALQLEDIDAPRPMTHDLLRSLIENLDARVDRVVITDLREGTYYAEIHLEANGKQIVVDSRPSDAIALALRMSADIYADEEVFEKTGHRLEQAEESWENIDRVKEWIDDISPDDFSQGLH